MLCYPYLTNVPQQDYSRDAVWTQHVLHEADYSCGMEAGKPPRQEPILRCVQSARSSNRLFHVCSRCAVEANGGSAGELCRNGPWCQQGSRRGLFTRDRGRTRHMVRQGRAPMNRDLKGLLVYVRQVPTQMGMAGLQPYQPGAIPEREATACSFRGMRELSVATVGRLSLHACAQAGWAGRYGASD